MSKILVVGKYWPPFQGGIEDISAAISEKLSEYHTVISECFNHNPGSNYKIINGVNVRRRKSLVKIKSQPIGLSYFFGVLFTRADVIFFHAPNVVASLALVIRGSTPWASPIITMHHMDIYGRPLLRRLALSLYDQVLRKSQWLVVTSNKNKVISSDIRVPVATKVIPLGVDPEAFIATGKQRAEADALVSHLTGSASTPTLLFIGRHARYKGLDVLIRATARLNNIHAIVAGDGPYRADAQQLAKELGITERVHFIGKVSTDLKIGLLATCTVFGFPSTEITEAFGISQLEAMAAGIPVVSTNLQTGVTDVAVADKTALVVPPGDADAFAAAVTRLTSDPDLGKRLVTEARQQLLAKFTRGTIIRQHVELVESVLGCAEKAGSTGRSEPELAD